MTIRILTGSRVTSGHKKRAETDSPRHEESRRGEIVGGGESEERRVNAVTTQLLLNRV